MPAAEKDKTPEEVKIIKKSKSPVQIKSSKQQSAKEEDETCVSEDVEAGSQVDAEKERKKEDGAVRVIQGPGLAERLKTKVVLWL